MDGDGVSGPGPDELEYEALFCMRDIAMVMRDAVSVVGGDPKRLSAVADALERHLQDLIG